MRVVAFLLGVLTALISEHLLSPNLQNAVPSDALLAAAVPNATAPIMPNDARLQLTLADIQTADEWTSPASIPRVGLINHGATNHHFTDELDFAEVNTLLINSSLIMAAADEDASARNMSRKEYLQAIADEFDKFIKSRELCGREDIKAEVLDVLNSTTGSFGILLGGMATGK